MQERKRGNHEERKAMQNRDEIRTSAGELRRGRKSLRPCAAMHTQWGEGRLGAGVHWPLSPEIEEVKSCADTRQRHTWEPGQRRTRRCVKGVAWNQRRCWECLATLRTLTKSGSPREDVTTPASPCQGGPGQSLEGWRQAVWPERTPGGKREEMKEDQETSGNLMAIHQCQPLVQRKRQLTRKNPHCTTSVHLAVLDFSQLNYFLCF